MKTLKATMMSLVLLLICGVANAAPKSFFSKTKDEAVNTYVNAVVHGKVTGVDNAIDDDAQFNMTRGASTKTLNKGEELELLNASANIEQSCQFSTSVVQSTDDTFVEKVDMKYADFTRTDVVTAQRSGDGWKITKVETSFK